MPFADEYLLRNSVAGRITHPPDKNLRYIVVIPCYDEPGLTITLESLWSCQRPANSVEVIVVINSAINSPPAVLERNLSTLKEAEAWISKHTEPGFRFYLIHESGFPARIAGPGLARKTGMDQAVARFNETDDPDGIILSFDADTTCSPDYFTGIEALFRMHPETNAFTLYFEHPLEGSLSPPEIYRAITDYELHLRYHIQAIRNTGFPHAFHTIGSCFGVKAGTYVRQGGMNKRKGGEDFYFLHKVIPLGHFYEINTTCVYPSPRPSVRVPFGTGPFIRKYIEEGTQEYQTYNPASFGDLQALFNDPGSLFQCSAAEQNAFIDSLPSTIRDFCGPELRLKIREINDNSASPGTFRKRFYGWFNMFRILKFLNHVHEKSYTRVPVHKAAMALLEEMGYPFKGRLDNKGLLRVFREIQKS